MKALAFVTMMILTFTTATAVEKFVAEKIVAEADGTIENRVLDDDVHILIGSVPSYYSETLVQQSVSSVVRRFSDVKMIRSWERSDDGSIQAVIDVADSPVMIGYYSDLKELRIAWYD